MQGKIGEQILLDEYWGGAGGSKILDICTKFPVNIFDPFKFILPVLNIKKGHKSSRKVGGLYL